MHPTVIWNLSTLRQKRGDMPKAVHNLTTMLIYQKTNERTTQSTSATSALNSLSVSKPQNADSPEMQRTKFNVLVIVLWGDSNVFGFLRRHPLPELPARGFVGFCGKEQKQKPNGVKKIKRKYG